MLVDVDMAVVPHRAGGLGDEFVRVGIAGCDGGLGRAGDTVILPGAFLQQAVPMNGVRQRGQVGDIDRDFIAFHDVEQWRRNLAIEREGMKVLVIDQVDFGVRSEEHTSELQSLMRISYAVFCLKKKQSKQYTK